MSQYDVIVVGVGGVGSSTLYHLARSGVKVLGLDRFSPGHDRGSSHGGMRMVRRAYYEHPSYVPLVDRALQEWRELEESREETLYHPVGILNVGKNDGPLISGVRASVEQHKVDVDELTPAQFKKRAPGIHRADDHVALFEKNAGYLQVEACVQAYADEAVKAGAELRVGGAVRNWSARTSSVTVETESRTFTAGRLVVTPGPWARDLLLDLCIPFEVRRKPVYWYQTEGNDYQASKGVPAFLYETGDGIFYGYPQVDKFGVKVGEHTGGMRVQDPLGLDRGVDPQDQKRVETFLADHLPNVKRRCMQHSVCMYTMSPDSHFVIDRHPHHENVAFAAGLSGHGFKFTSILGKLLAGIVMGEAIDPDLKFLHCNRPGLRFTDADFEETGAV